jgi:hypothetical protein
MLYYSIVVSRNLNKLLCLWLTTPINCDCYVLRFIIVINSCLPTCPFWYLLICLIILFGLGGWLWDRQKLAKLIPGLRPWEVLSIEQAMDQIAFNGQWYREPLGSYTTGPPFIRRWNDALMVCMTFNNRI